MANTYLSRTPSSTSNRKTWTFSAWVKRTGFGAGNVIFDAGVYGGNNYSPLFFTPTGTIRFYEVVGGSLQWNVETTRKFNDCNGWYHIIMAVDTTQATTTNRVKLYINGIQETIFSPESVPSQNYDTLKNFSSQENNIGIASDNRLSPFDGLMSHIHFCDGQQLAPTVFGSTDSTTGEWKIITDPTFTPGTNGFTILKNGNTITDQSANSNNWSLGAGTLTKTEDNPSDVFATLNFNDNNTLTGSFYYGNTYISGQASESTKYYCGLTLGMMGNGKYYFEGKLAVNNQAVLGVCNLDASDNPTYLRQQNTFPGRYASSFGYDFTDGGYFNNNSKTAYGGTSWSANNYFSIALDNTNKKMYIAQNGSWVNSGNPTNGTGGIDYSSIGDNNMFIVADNNGAGYNKFFFNFGNGVFASTPSSPTYSPTVGNTSAKFRFNIIPSGYTALSTKGLNL